jgi:hypothetical protein
VPPRDPGDELPSQAGLRLYAGALAGDGHRRRLLRYALLGYPCPYLLAREFGPEGALAGAGMLPAQGHAADRADRGAAFTNGAPRGILTTRRRLVPVPACSTTRHVNILQTSRTDISAAACTRVVQRAITPAVTAQ